MTITYESNNYGDVNIPPHSAGEVYVSDDVVELPATLALNQLAAVGILPAGCVPVDVKLIADKLDTNATDTLTLAVGLLNTAQNDLVAASTFITGATADATVNVTTGNAIGMMGIAPDNENDRILALKCTAAAATKAAGGVRVIMTYRASNYGA